MADMTIYKINPSILTNISDSIRARLQTTDSYKPIEMSDAILSIDNGVIISRDPLYSLTPDTEFTGTEYFDTGIKLFSSDMDFTIIGDVECSYNDAQVCLVHCMHEASPWNGLTIDFPKNQMRFIVRSTSNTTILSGIGVKNDRNAKFVFSHVSGSQKYDTYFLNRNNDVEIHTAFSTPFYSASENLLIGAYQTTSGTIGRNLIGTVHQLDIYDFAFSKNMAWYCLAQ